LIIETLNYWARKRTKARIRRQQRMFETLKKPNWIRHFFHQICNLYSLLLSPPATRISPQWTHSLTPPFLTTSNTADLICRFLLFQATIFPKIVTDIEGEGKRSVLILVLAQVPHHRHRLSRPPSRSWTCNLQPFVPSSFRKFEELYYAGVAVLFSGPSNELAFGLIITYFLSSKENFNFSSMFSLYKL
uniref:Very-long-chain (3R)-3-hydroxyacyl-CoA dehydratase n=1 Tax=Rodentolepis nana TaxID=102285 RepID=A0A0R3TX54_RODNA